MSDIKREFEKACYDEVVRCCRSGETVNGFNFGAKWMAEKCAEMAHKAYLETDSLVVLNLMSTIRLKAKELSNE